MKVYVINLHEHESIGSHWIDLYANTDNAAYFHCFCVEYIAK